MVLLLLTILINLTSLTSTSSLIFTKQLRKKADSLRAQILRSAPNLAKRKAMSVKGPAMRNDNRENGATNPGEPTVQANAGKAQQFTADHYAT